MNEFRIQLSAGRGPVECAWAVAELVTRLEREAARCGIGVRHLDDVAGDVRGTFRSVLLGISGPGADRFTQEWSGTLCWQAPSPFRRGAGRKNWYVRADRLELSDVHPVFSPDDVEMVPVRTGGPGGQHRNKASTAVRATYRPTGAVIVVDTERRLSDNRRLALERLLRQVDEAGAEAGRAQEKHRWRTHDRIVRGNPTRTERP